MKLIGLTGKARSGKDTVAEYISSKLFMSIDELTYAFADPLREMITAMLGKDAYIDAVNDKESTDNWTGKSYRELLQTLGTEWGRNMIDRELWIKKAEQERQEAIADGYDLMVVTDVRMTNEAQWIKDNGGILVKITRESTEPVRPHESENGICQNLIDVEIDNNRTLEDLYQSVDSFLKGEGLL